MEPGAAMMMGFILLSFPLNVRRLFWRTIQAQDDSFSLCLPLP